MSTLVNRDISTRIRVATAGSLSPTVEWRASTPSYTVQTAIAPTGSGYGGAIPLGTSSNVITLRLYNNFQGGGGIADAVSCVLACYDDTLHQGQATTLPVTNAYLAVSVADYNGTTTGSDGGTYYAIGGSVKHPVPVNSGTIGGATTNYVTINIKIVVPSSATQGAVTQGLWVEYTATA